MARKNNTKKKKLLTVKGTSGGYTTNFTSSIAFALVGPPDEERKQVTNWVTCREALYAAVKTFINSKNSNSEVNGTYKSSCGPIDMSKLRLLLHRECNSAQTTADLKAKLFSGKRILNIYEKAAGWPLSKITTVNHSDKTDVWLLTGPKEWMSSPHLLSMAMLIMRLAAARGPFEATNMAETQALWQRMVDNVHGNSDVNTYLAASHKYFPILIKYYKTLFTDTIEEAYSDPDSVGFNKGGGIHSLCKCESVNKRLQEAVQAQMRK